jgi:pSer/pThr/pTyr-binding forkhead associated (FHA) protein
MTGIIALIFRIVLAGALYAFLGWALYTLWSDLRRQTSHPSIQKVPTMIITVGEGDAQTTTEFSIPEIMIGRDPTCDLVLREEIVSSRHARLSYHHNQWWIEDLQSTNGTYLNDERLYTATVVVSGDEIVCGQARLMLAIQPSFSEFTKENP